ncbi:50S ribosomal protein L4 [bacterium K02(2017)]|nr:50S ribosomal protein L4 [bacterium K02(2017)]
MPLEIVDIQSKKVGEIALNTLVDDKLNKAVLYYAVKANLNNVRHGNSSVKQRSDINKTKKKLYRQKGTGNARHGARSANIFVGGGVTHGPRPRSYTEKVNKKFKKNSYQQVVKYLVQNNKLKVVNELNFEKASTKKAAEIISKLNINNVLVVLPNDNTNAKLSFRNLKDVRVINDININVYDFVRSQNVLMTADTFNVLKERYSL